MLQTIITLCDIKQISTFAWESFSSLPLDGRGESAAANSWANEGLGDAGITDDGLWITLLGFGPGFLRARKVIKYYYGIIPKVTPKRRSQKSTTVNFLTSCKPVSFSRRTPLLGVRK